MVHGDALLFTFHYVSIKSELNGTSVHVEIVFTFHYVSIKSLEIGNILDTI